MASMKKVGEREILAFELVVMGRHCVPRLVGEASQAQFVQGFEGAVFLLSFFSIISAMKKAATAIGA